LPINYHINTADTANTAAEFTSETQGKECRVLKKPYKHNEYQTGLARGGGGGGIIFAQIGHFSKRARMNECSNRGTSGNNFQTLDKDKERS
jgi:hypothetical protein